MTERFIRLDMEGHWKGTEHCSTFAYDPEYWGDETVWENGISCYSLTNDPAHAIESLRRYWEVIAQMRGNYETPVKMLVTIFEGYVVDGEGADGEPVAVCEKTIKQFPAQEFMTEIIEAEVENYYDDEVYEKELLEIVGKYDLMK